MLRQQMGGQPMIAVQAPQAIFQAQSGQNIAIPIQNLGQNIYLTQPSALQQAAAAQVHQQQQQNSVKDEPHWSTYMNSGKITILECETL